MDSPGQYLVPTVHNVDNVLQAGNAGLREVPAGQRHVHHRPIGQAGQW